MAGRLGRRRRGGAVRGAVGGGVGRAPAGCVWGATGRRGARSARRNRRKDSEGKIRLICGLR
jgi:hypothetical protein